MVDTQLLKGKRGIKSGHRRKTVPKAKIRTMYKGVTESQKRP